MDRLTVFADYRICGIEDKENPPHQIIYISSENFTFGWLVQTADSEPPPPSRFLFSLVVSSLTEPPSPLLLFSLVVLSLTRGIVKLNRSHLECPYDLHPERSFDLHPTRDYPLKGLTYSERLPWDLWHA